MKKNQEENASLKFTPLQSQEEQNEENQDSETVDKEIESVKNVSETENSSIQNQEDNQEIENESDDIDNSEEVSNPAIITLPFRQPDPVNNAADRALTGKRPSMRPPRRDARHPASPELERAFEALMPENLINVSLSSPSYTPDVLPVFRQEARKERMPLPGMILKEDIQLHLDHDALLEFLKRSINEQYRTAGLEVDGEVEIKCDARTNEDDEEDFHVQLTYRLHANMKRVNKRTNEDE